MITILPGRIAPYILNCLIALKPSPRIEKTNTDYDEKLANMLGRIYNKQTTSLLLDANDLVGILQANLTTLQKLGIVYLRELTANEKKHYSGTTIEVREEFNEETVAYIQSQSAQAFLNVASKIYPNLMECAQKDSNLSKLWKNETALEQKGNSKNTDLEETRKSDSEQNSDTSATATPSSLSQSLLSSKT